MGMQWLLCLISTKYGQVKDGKYKGCGMGLGSDDKGVSTDVNWTKLHFIKGTKMIAEVRIETLKSYKILCQTVKATTIVLTFADDEKCTVELPALDANGKPFVNDRVGLVLNVLSSVSVEV